MEILLQRYDLVSKKPNFMCQNGAIKKIFLKISLFWHVLCYLLSGKT